MAETKNVLKAEAREKVGKSYALKLREEGKLPAVIYGPDMKENVYISIDYKEFDKTCRTCGKHKVITIELGKKKFTTVIKDYIIDSITRNFQHADFYAISEKKPFTTTVPVNYIGTPVGVKEGGSIFIFTRKLKISTELANLPESIDIDVSALKIGQWLIVRDIEAKGYKMVSNEGDILVQVK